MCQKLISERKSLNLFLLWCTTLSQNSSQLVVKFRIRKRNQVRIWFPHFNIYQNWLFGILNKEIFYKLVIPTFLSRNCNLCRLQFLCKKCANDQFISSEIYFWEWQYLMDLILQFGSNFAKSNDATISSHKNAFPLQWLILKLSNLS